MAIVGDQQPLSELPESYGLACSLGNWSRWGMGTRKVARVTDSSSSEFGSEVAPRLRGRLCPPQHTHTHTHTHTRLEGPESTSSPRKSHGGRLAVLADSG